MPKIYKRNCDVCGKHYENSNEKYCSHKCRGIARGKLKGTINYKIVVQNKGWLKKGHTTWNKGLKGYRAGELNNHWKGGITPLNHKIRTSLDFKNWRESVFARDNWTCQKCNKRGVELHAHHIKLFSLYQDLRFVVDNGMTLCEECHKLEHKNNG
ncbi:HNH endonuclease [Candidatus Dojkabacteria bacterium]|jgi:5-methylcytosine-specific restriction endonuclease McrA|nr:HNH endonuclease [Candidatus Dojkabacteria bacterium]